MKPHYSEASVQPISASVLADGQLSLIYRVPLESMFFSPGVDYQTQAGTLRVVIGRCRIRTDCAVMAEHVRPLTADGMAEVRLPYRGEKVVVVHADREQLLTM
ncbi:hypothetical protein J5226_22335 [Lysobacter sp. K5869]|uniref:hypothetical protein n=1 Tax=Lysobacter sp. K5869 TaxID=2820808 RepID=UPI001C06372A|nr:hypothetical protein [Lysobacter sp. K5869]QWP76294.1 hypothetical protein J5226_22335 [Lysobacter sp. K5869]